MVPFEVTVFKIDEPKIVDEVTVISSWALLSDGKEHYPGGDRLLYGKYCKSVVGHTEHWPAFLALAHESPQLE